MKVCIDPGHGGPDSGAGGNGIVEKVVNMKVSLAVRDLLKADGHEVAMTRTSDTAFSHGVTPGAGPITSRGRFSVKSGADIFVSVHHDAGGNPKFRGCSSFYHAGAPNGADLAASITTRLHERLGLPYAYGGPAQVHWKNLGVLRGGDNWKHVTACLVECATLTGTLDAALIKGAGYVSSVARCIVDGIMAHAAKEGLVIGEPGASALQVVGLDGKSIECAAGWSGERVTVAAAPLLAAIGVPLTALKPGTVHGNGRAFVWEIGRDLPEWEFVYSVTKQGPQVKCKPQ